MIDSLIQYLHHGKKNLILFNQVIWNLKLKELFFIYKNSWVNKHFIFLIKTETRFFFKRKKMQVNLKNEKIFSIMSNYLHL